MGALVQTENRDHWYDKQGNPCFQVPYADKKRAGEMRATTVTDARKLGLLPSVTTILGVISKQFLTSWLIQQAIYSCLTLPRLEGEGESDFAKRVVVDMDEQRDNAARQGNEIEDAVRKWARAEEYGYKEQVDAFAELMHQHNGKILAMGTRAVGPDYVGTTDFLILWDGRIMLMDLKTQDGKPNHKTGGLWPYNYYESWCYQLEGYAPHVQWEGKPVEGTMNIVIDRTNAGLIDFHEWPENHEKEMDRIRGRQNFLAAKTIFENEKRHWPGRAA